MAKKAAEYLQIGSALAAQRLVSDPVEVHHGLFIMTEEESQKITTPAVSMLARHQVGGEVLGDNDLADAISLALAFVKYLSGNFKDRQTLRAQYAPAFSEDNQVKDPNQEVRSSPAGHPAEEPLDTATQGDAAQIDPESQLNYLRGFVRPGLQ